MFESYAALCKELGFTGRGKALTQQQFLIETLETSYPCTDGYRKLSFSSAGHRGVSLLRLPSTSCRNGSCIAILAVPFIIFGATARNYYLVDSRNAPHPLDYSLRYDLTSHRSSIATISHRLLACACDRRGSRSYQTCSRLPATSIPVPISIFDSAVDDMRLSFIPR